jgi:DNA-binding XRE family transcriptional regulator
MGRRPLDLTGRTFGRLTAARRVGHRHGAALWLCRCECGNETRASVRSLTEGNTRSCGCLRRELTGERFRAKDNRTERYLKLWKNGRGWSMSRIAAPFGVCRQGVSQRIRNVVPPPKPALSPDRGKHGPQMAEIGRRIRELRQQAGLSQAELADKLGVRQKVVCGWELAKCLLVATQVPALADALGVQIGELFTPAAGPRPRHVV